MRTRRLLVIGMTAMAASLIGSIAAAPVADAQACSFDGPNVRQRCNDVIENKPVLGDRVTNLPSGGFQESTVPLIANDGGVSTSVVAEAPYQQRVMDARAGRLGDTGCTAFAINPTVLLTAAHCVYDIPTGRTTPPEALSYYVTNGAIPRRVTSVKVSPQWIENTGVPNTLLANTGADWAVLTYEPNEGIPFYPVQLAQPAFGQRVTALGATDTPGSSYLMRPDPVPSNYNIVESLLGVESSFATGMKIGPGFSGGPVLNEAGEVIGINSSFNAFTGVTQHVRITCEIARFAIGTAC